MNGELDNMGQPGTFLGRYGGPAGTDHYTGCDPESDGGSKGHIWILCSNALGELLYRNSEYYW